MYCPECGTPYQRYPRQCHCGHIFAGEAPPVPAGAAAVHRYTFHGDVNTLFGLMFTNLLLTIVTLGIYAFWARTKTRKYLSSQTEFQGERYAYHGTAEELFLGFLRGVGVVFLWLLLWTLWDLAWGLVGIRGFQNLLFLLISPMMLIPIVAGASYRYRLSRTSYRGIRFSFRGTPGEYLGICLKGGLLTLLTVGFYFPFFVDNTCRFLVNHSWYGNTRFEYDGKASDLYGSWLVALLLTLPTLGIYWLWFLAKEVRYSFSHLRFGDLRYEYTATGGELFGLSLTNSLLALVTLGFAIPWLLIRSIRFGCEHLLIRGTVDWNAMAQEARGASSTA
jgi:uncharacterized membrane protein YjgN (DUF898 family)